MELDCSGYAFNCGDVNIKSYNSLLSPIKYQESRKTIFGSDPKDSTFCVMKQGEIVFASELERYTKIKHDGCQNMSQVVYSFIKNCQYTAYLSDLNFMDSPRSHHISHIYETFYNSGFDDAAIMVIDGKGTEDDSVTLAYMKRGEEPVILKKYSDNVSLGALYHTAASMIFPETSFGEGKVMGMAPYGRPIDKKFYDFENGEIIKHHSKDTFFKSINHYRTEFQNEFINGGSILGYAPLAATVQRDYEFIVVELTKYLKKLLKQNKIETDNLCLSGGCILNCPGNSKIVELGLFKHYYACPFPGDGGNCFGNLYYMLIRKDPKNAFKFKGLKSAYLGVEVGDDWIDQTIESNRIQHNVRVYHFNMDMIMEHLAKDGIIGWYQGRSEFGPRALGHRSFLASPLKYNTLFELNRLKNREYWRPLAPIIPEELFPIMFDDRTDNYDMCEFMLRTMHLKEEWAQKCSAIAHIDNTCRPQLLRKWNNPELYQLLMRWYEISGIPCLINTSLNIKGLPIVETPMDALEMNDMMFDKTIPPKVPYMMVMNAHRMICY